jgi:aspartokinase/homoserine dehydrogenase 1
MRVLKFGGTSLATVERIDRVGAIVAAARAAGPVAVVVSAAGGVTNDLVTATEQAAVHDRGYESTWRAVVERHRELLAAVTPDEEGEALSRTLEAWHEELGDLLHGVYLLREASPRTRDGILSYGERVSAVVVAAALRRRGLPARAVDARQHVLTDTTFGHARVDLEATLPRLARALDPEPSVPVLTGFVAATAAGETTTLGRGGSDLTAALAGVALGADAIELWTDVSGVMSADPRLVPDAFPLPRLSYDELVELSHFGAKVVFPPTVHPAREHGIPLVIKNTLDPAAPGTRIEEGRPPNPHPIRGISSIHHVALMRLEGDGMIGVPGIAMRLFGALARRGVSVILISQGSSEHSICFAVAPDHAEEARRAVDEEFALERRVGLVEPLTVEGDMAVVAAVGAEMRERPGIAGRLFGVLGRHGVNVRAIAQGSSELNVSLVVAARDEPAAVNAIHGAFFRPPRPRVDVAVFGVGTVGGTLLEQLRDGAGRVAESEGIEIRVVAIADSRRLASSPEGLDLARWRELLDEAGEGGLDSLVAMAGERRVFVDCTAAARACAGYPRLLAAGWAVVSANKKPFAGSGEAFQELLATARRHGLPLRHEATVGAGLPILSTLGSLVASGDRVTALAGVLSGTLNFVCEGLAAGETLSRAVGRAMEAGLTEPDPWDDLGGEDVRRKLVIAGRVAGLAAEPEAVELEPLVPGEGWAGMPADAFRARLEALDERFRERQEEAARRGCRLRYLAELDGQGARVGLVAVGAEHPCFRVGGADNRLAVTSERYAASPLVVSGPGAGPAVTAAGVFADLLQAARELGASRGDAA